MLKEKPANVQFLHNSHIIQVYLCDVDETGGGGGIIDNDKPVEEIGQWAQVVSKRRPEEHEKLCGGWNRLFAGWVSWLRRR